MIVSSVIDPQPRSPQFATAQRAGSRQSSPEPASPPKAFKAQPFNAVRLLARCLYVCGGETGIVSCFSALFTYICFLGLFMSLICSPLDSCMCNNNSIAGTQTHKHTRARRRSSPRRRSSRTCRPKSRPCPSRPTLRRSASPRRRPRRLRLRTSTLRHVSAIIAPKTENLSS